MITCKLCNTKTKRYKQGCFYSNEDKIKHRDYYICNTCIGNPEIMLTATQIKQRYKLTDNDLYDTNLTFCIINNWGSLGSKYIKSEIEELFYKLFNTTPSTSSRRKLLNKANEQLQIEINKKKIKELLTVYLQKYEPADISDWTYYLSSTINREYNTNNTIFRTAILILLDINQRIHITKAINKLDSLINLHIVPEYIKKVNDFTLYKSCVSRIREGEYNINIEAIVNNIANIINTKIAIKKKQEEKLQKLNNYISTTYQPAYHTFIKQLPCYHQYITPPFSSFEDTKNNINSELILNTNKYICKLIIDNWISKNIDQKYIKTIKNDDYIKFISAGNINDISNIKNLINTTLTNKINFYKNCAEFDTKMKELNININDSALYPLKYIPTYNKIRSNYVNKLSSFEYCIDQIRQLIQYENLKRLTNENEYHIIKKLTNYDKFLSDETINYEDLLNEIKLYRTRIYKLDSQVPKQVDRRTKAIRINFREKVLKNPQYIEYIKGNITFEDILLLLDS